MHSMCPFDACTGRECCRLAGARYLAFPSASLREASGSLISFDPIYPSLLGDIAGARAPKEHRGRSPGGLGAARPAAVEPP